MKSKGVVKAARPLSSLGFSDLREANFKRITHFKDRDGAPIHTPSGRGFDWFNAFIGEIGELATWRKKYERGDISREEFVREASKEVADIVTYLDIYAAVELDLDMGAAVTSKFNEVSTRIQSSVFLQPEWPEGPAVIEGCFNCHGTGIDSDLYGSHECARCKGTGRADQDERT